MKKYLCAILISALLIGLCSCGVKPIETSGNMPVEASDLENLKEFIENQEVTLAENTTPNAAAAGYSLGNATITPAENNAVTVSYSPIGGPVFAELMDSAGNVWRLDIPENALSYGENITMQLSENISSDLVSGTMNAGVILQPEGLQFVVPATLTVTGPAAAEHTCVFRGNQAGESLNFAAVEVEEDSLSIQVQHFSSYIVYTPHGDVQISQLAAKATESYDAVLKEVSAFLKTPISAPAMPMDYAFLCDEEEGSLASSVRNWVLNTYTAGVLQPELDLADKIVGAGMQVQLLAGESDAIYFAGLLEMRNLKKADKLIKAYKKDVNKLIPVMNVTFKVLKRLSSLGVDVPLDYYMETFSDWMARAADEQIKKIREEHDYKALAPAIALISGSAIMESDFSVAGTYSKKYLEELKKAMTFTVTYDVSLASGIGDQKMKLSGEVELSWLDENNERYYSAEGKGKYLSYTHSGPFTTTIDFPNNYPVNMTFVDFSPCNNKKFKVQVDTIGAKSEVWYNPTLDERSSSEYSFVNFMAEELFKDYITDSGAFTFELPFHNKNVIMGSGSFTKTDTISYAEEGNAMGSITYVVEVKHTPK